MRHFILFLAFLAGGALILWGASFWGYDDLVAGLGAGAGLALVIGAIVSIRRWGRQMREDLLAGKDVIARWQLSPADLAAFQAVDRDRAADGRYFYNHLILPRQAPPAGVPIVIGRKSWLIGDRLYPSGVSLAGLVANVAMLEGDPDYIEIAVLGKKRGAAYLLLLYRLPVPRAARPAADVAFAHLAARVPQPNNHRLWHFFPEYVWGVGGIDTRTEWTSTAY